MRLNAQSCWLTAICSATVFSVCVGCKQQAQNYNPERSAALLNESHTELIEAQKSLNEAKTQIEEARRAAVNVGKFPWYGWSVEAGTVVKMKSPAGISYEYKFTAPVKNFDSWDQVSDAIIKDTEGRANPKGYAIEFSGQTRILTPSEKAAVDEVPERLRPSLSKIDDSLDELERLLAEVKAKQERASDLLPSVGDEK